MCLFRFDDSIIDSVEPPEHLQMIRADTNDDDDDEEEDDITDGGFTFSTCHLKYFYLNHDSGDN